MQTLAHLTTPDNRTVHYARLYDALEGYAVPTPAGTLFIDHDQHIYTLDADHLGAVPAIERLNVLAALARCAEVA
jgi:hypothetical protein